MDGADYVVIDGILFETEYLRVPDEYTVADDVILEASHGDTEIDVTHAEFEGAVGTPGVSSKVQAGIGVYPLASAAGNLFPNTLSGDERTQAMRAASPIHSSKNSLIHLSNDQTNPYENRNHPNVSFRRHR